MKRMHIWLTALTLVSGLVATGAMAQKGVGDAIGVARQPVQPELVTLSGTVMTIKIEPCEKTTGPSTTGTHIFLKDSDENVWNLHLGPTASVKYVTDQLVVGQEVTATVFRTDKLPNDNYVAQTLTIEETPFRLRDEKLRPLWTKQGSAKRGPVRGPGQALGQGRGQALSQGRGQGRCRGRGQALGQGRGQGRGQAIGQGRGQGRCRGSGQGRGQGGGHPNSPACVNFSAQALTDLAAQGQISDREAEDLRNLREEEKLAHDVYVALATKWQVPIFTNISQAESRHMNAMARLLEVYQLDDPVGNRDEGDFSNPRFTKLYQELVQAGSGSLVEAYHVGALIEELDISDLQNVTVESTQPLVKQVFGNLQRASRNHLRAFAAQLAQQGETYEAKHLSQAQFDSIANSAWERGSDGQGRVSQKGRGAGWGRGQGRGAGQRNVPRQGRGGGGRGRGQGRGAI